MMMAMMADSPNPDPNSERFGLRVAVAVQTWLVVTMASSRNATETRMEELNRMGAAWSQNGTVKMKEGEV